MANNEVRIVFTGEAGQLFALTDQVEARLRRINGAIDSNPVMAAQVANAQRLAQATAQSGAQRIAAEQAVTRAVSSEIDKQIAAKRKAVEPVQQRRKPFDPNDPAVQAERDRKRAESAARVNAEMLAGEQQSAALANQFRRRQFQERIASGLQESRILTAQLATRTAAIQAGERAVTATVIAESTKQRAARRSALGLGQGLSQVGSAVGVSGLSAAGAGGIAVAGLTVAGAINFGKDAAASYMAANQRALELRASLEGLGQDYRKVGADAAAFADRHNQDITTINTKYAEFVKLAQQQGAVVDEVGRRAIDVASKRQLSDTQLAEGLAKIRAGIADESILGASATTVMVEFAAAHGKTTDALTAAEKKLAVYNEFIRQSSLAAGDAKTHTTGLTTATTQLANAWERVNIGMGAVIERYVNAPPEILRLLGTAGSPYGPALPMYTLPPPPAIDPALKAEQERARQQAAAKNRADLERAQANPLQNIVNFGLSRLDPSHFLKLDPDQQDKVRSQAITTAKEIVGAQAREFEIEVERAGANIPRLQFLRQNLNNLRGLIDPSEFSRLAGQASKAVNDSFKSMVTAAGQNVSRLREILGQVRLTSALLGGDRDDLERSVSEAIDRAVEAGRQKVNELRGNVLSMFDSVAQIQGARNPYVRIFNEADRGLRDLRRNTIGFSKDIQNALAQPIQNQLRTELFGLRADSRLNAFDLQDQARQFRAGRLDDPNDLQRLNARLEEQIRIIGGFRQVPVFRGMVSGGGLPAEQIFGMEFRADRSLTPDEQRLANQRIISRTQGLDPSKLSPFVNEAAASAREQEAKAVLDAEKEAQKERAEQTKLLKSIDAGLQRLDNVVSAGGIEALKKAIGDHGMKVDLQGQAITNIEVRSKDLDAAKRDQAARPRGSDTKAAMQP